MNKRGQPEFRELTIDAQYVCPQSSRRLAPRFRLHRPTGFADGRQTFALFRGTSVTLLKPAPLDRGVYSRRTAIVAQDVVVGYHVPLVGVIPAPPHVGEPLSRVIHQGVGNSHYAPYAVAGFDIGLPPHQAPVVQRLDIPLHLRQSAVQAR